MLGAHSLGDNITVVVKGGPDSSGGTFPDPSFSETSADIVITPEPSPTALLTIGLIGGALVTRARRTAVWKQIPAFQASSLGSASPLARC